jgi:hypothetical protein
MATKPKLNEDDYERIKNFLDTEPYERSPEDLVPEDSE